MNSYYDLTKQEREELSERLANGEISRACKKSDWFNIKLSSGRTACGVYAHESESGEFIRLAIVA
jgi:hypothetical protein